MKQKINYEKERYETEVIGVFPSMKKETLVICWEKSLSTNYTVLGWAHVRKHPIDVNGTRKRGLVTDDFVPIIPSDYMDSDEFREGELFDSELYAENTKFYLYIDGKKCILNFK